MTFAEIPVKQRFKLPGNEDVLVKENDGPVTTGGIKEDVGMAGYEKYWCGDEYGFGGGTFVKPDQEVILV
jgi:hypothetical protein